VCQPKDKNTDIQSTGGEFAGPQRVQLLEKKHWSFIQRKYQLTSREIQVAKLICQGLTYVEIAEELKIKTGTVKTHLRNNYRKIRVNTKIQMLLQFVNDVTQIISPKDDNRRPAIFPVTYNSSDSKKIPFQKLRQED